MGGPTPAPCVGRGACLIDNPHETLKAVGISGERETRSLIPTEYNYRQTSQQVCPAKNSLFKQSRNPG